jgi:hypothetical protein
MLARTAEFSGKLRVMALAGLLLAGVSATGLLGVDNEAQLQSLTQKAASLQLPDREPMALDIGRWKPEGDR